MRSSLNLRAAVRASSPSLVALLRRHRAITRLALAGLALAVALGVSLQDAAAGLPRPNMRQASILPETVGTGILTTQPVTLTFDQPMDNQSVDAALSVRPDVAYTTSWGADHRSVTLIPQSRWATDQRYVVTVPDWVATAVGRPFDGRQVAFTTQTAPVVSEFGVHLVAPAPVDAKQAIGDLSRNIPYGEQAMVLGNAPLIDAPEDTAADASAGTGIRIGFSTAMNRADVQSRFHIAPHVRGTFGWDGDDLTFTPTDRLKPGTRYAVSLVNAHDLLGNRLAGDVSFSFTTRADAQVLRFTPHRRATGVVSRDIVIRFSEPMDQHRTRGALRVKDLDTGRVLAGTMNWSDRGTRLRYRFTHQLPRGHTIEVRLGGDARDRDGNRLSLRWRFETARPEQSVANSTSQVSTPAAVRSGPNAPSGTLDYALWLINQSRAAYGFGPLRLDAAISEVAAAHAWDQINYGYFSHTGRDGSHVSDRLRAAGISFSWSGENMCYYNGMGVRAMLDWCHSTFMSEPYPGVANHIGNILSSHYNRVGVGIAQRGSKVIIVWDFAG